MYMYSASENKMLIAKIFIPIDFKLLFVIYKNCIELIFWKNDHETQ